MSGSGGTIRVVTGIVVQKQTVRLPVGLTVSDPTCVENPENCCDSGGPAGCCYPRPTDNLFATRFGTSGDCACPPVCVPLYYSHALDAWYSDPINPYCDVKEPRYLRLKCIDDSYHFDLTDGDAGGETVLVAGAIQNVPPQSCDPYLLAARFDDGANAYLCAGTYDYVIVEIECGDGSGSGSGDGSGSGGGGTVPTSCCPDALLPLQFLATFSGALAALGTVPFSWIGGGVWQGVALGCGDDGAGAITEFACQGANWQLSHPGTPLTGTEFDDAGAAESCDPFVWNGSGVAAGACAGAWSVVIRG